MNIQVYAYNPTNERYTMDVNGTDYYFTYDHKQYTVLNSWDANGKLIARSYKGFRNKLGIQGSSPNASKLMDALKQVRTLTV